MAILFALAAAAAFDSCTGGLCQADELNPWFDKLAHIRSVQALDRRPLHILQIGDSHTAGDAITGAWRDMLQAQYGSGGRGVMPPGKPYNGYTTHGMTVSMSPGWTIKSIFGATASQPWPPVGLSGFSVTSQMDNATMGVVSDAGEAFNRFVICALAAPGAGTLSIRLGFTTTDLDLNSFATRTTCKTITTPDVQFNAAVVAHGGPVTITSWATFRDGTNGIALSNVGVVGSQLEHFARTDDSVVAEELRAYRPDLIVIAFGTNEGFSPRVNPTEYELTLRSQIGRIRRLAGNVPLLMLGVPDAATRNSALFNNGPGAPIDCNDQATSLADVMASIRVQEEAESGTSTPATATVPISRALMVPAGMATVRDVQRRVAAQLNIAFWDWGGRMGGACTSKKWVYANPPLMRGDFVHYTTTGGREIARMLQADLFAAQVEWRQ
jgi:lysophospholipase L1-like esterase